MRDRDRWWAFFRGDVDWEKIPCSQFHSQGKKKRKDNLTVEETKYPEPVVYQEVLSWDDVEEGDVQLTYQRDGIEEEVEHTHFPPEGEERNGSNFQSLPSGSQPTLTPTHQLESDLLQLREPTPRILALLDQVSPSQKPLARQRVFFYTIFFFLRNLFSIY